MGSSLGSDCGCLMGILRIMMAHKFQLMAVLTFGVAMLFIENQIQKLEDSRARLGKILQHGFFFLNDFQKALYMVIHN